MVEKGSFAAERLELLSNTAMLKKVLDKNEASSNSRSNSPRGTAFSRYEKPLSTPLAPAPPPVSASAPSPKSFVSDRSQQRESPSSPVVVEATRDSPPLSFGRPVEPKLVPQDYHLYTTSTMNGSAHGNPFRGYSSEASRYPSFAPPLPHYMHGAHGAHGTDRYFGDNRQSTPLVPLAPHPERTTYKETAPPPPFRVPYEERRHSDRRETRSFYSPVSEDGEESHRLSYEAMARENFHMREQLQDKDAVISSLQQRVNQLETQISELRQLPTGKISHIPIDDMLRIMEEYGSEVSNQTLPKRRDNIKKASIVRQFRRWNPEFFRYFIHVNGEWVPKLGKEGEIQRRVEKRREIKRQTNNKSPSDK